MNILTLGGGGYVGTLLYHELLKEKNILLNINYIYFVLKYISL
jgi:UDP-glucose 4-epimerase